MEMQVVSAGGQILNQVVPTGDQIWDPRKWLHLAAKFACAFACGATSGYICNEWDKWGGQKKKKAPLSK